MQQFKSFYIKDFPINRIINLGMDDWVLDKSHRRYKYKFLEVILEHIENEQYIEPIKVTYHSKTDTNAGPSGVARLYALYTIKNYTHIPAIVSINENHVSDLDDLEKVEILDRKHLRSYFKLEPASFGLDPNGNAYWQNQNPNPKQATATLNVSAKSLENFLKAIQND
jgi:hypothetical protein